MATQAMAQRHRRTMHRIGRRSRGRIAPAAAVAVVHVLFGYALIAGLSFERIETITERLKVFDIREPPPPPPPVPPPPAMPKKADEGAAAPPGLKAEPTPVVVPPAKI